ncbi:hypothetical protein FACS189456_5790 [Bacteroidia bacterium]|nr:hypothetical protein FACS189456_5790 [Bacteroidia bacterium]
MQTKVIQRFTALGYAVLVGTAVMAQGVAIGDKDFTPNSAAILDVRASNKGVRDVWNAKSNFSGSYSDLTNKPSFSLGVDGGEGSVTLATVATTGNYNDLNNKPRLRDLEQDEYYFTTVSKAERDAWNAKSTFSGSYADLSNPPTLATVATSGSYNDLQDKPTTFDFATVATTGSYEDLSNKPRLQDLQQDDNYYTTVIGYAYQLYNLNEYLVQHEITIKIGFAKKKEID